MIKQLRQPRRRRPPRDESGQAMVEYAIIVAGLMGGLTVMSFTFLPDFIDALQKYYDSFYIMISLPIP